MPSSRKNSGPEDQGSDGSAAIQGDGGAEQIQGQAPAAPEEGTGTPPQDGNPGSGDDPGAGNGDQDKDKDKPAETPKIGLARFLQISPQKKGVTALLVSKYRADVKTREQWEIAIADLLHKKAQ